jgi:uncharacterized protein (DUF433 family)/anti-anti-sigma regulatory factor
MAPKFYIDDELVFNVVEESEFFRLKILTPEIEEHHVEEFMDTTVEWLSLDPQKGILIDFSGVKYLCGPFAVTLNRTYEDIKARGIYVRFVNVDPTIEPYIDVSNITVVMTLPPPTKPRINASAILEDLANNMSDEELMNKYGLSERGLANMYGKILRKGLGGKITTKKKPSDGGDSLLQFDLDELKSDKPVVDAHEVLNDLSNGMSNQDLMHKYKLTSKGLQSLARKLYRRGLISAATLERLKAPAGRVSVH